MSDLPFLWFLPGLILLSLGFRGVEHQLTESLLIRHLWDCLQDPVAGQFSKGSPHGLDPAREIGHLGATGSSTRRVATLQADCHLGRFPKFVIRMLETSDQLAQVVVDAHDSSPWE
jgi:hypothetical protein